MKAPLFFFNFPSFPRKRESVGGESADAAMRTAKKAQARQRGFSIVEMGITLAVVSLILGGVLLPLSSQLRDRLIHEEEERMAEIVEAVVAYAVRNKTIERPIVEGGVTVAVAPAGRNYLPCPDITGDGVGDYMGGLTPASALTALTVVGLAGLTVSGVCRDQSGALPWRELGTPAVDAWGNHYTYRADIAFSNAVVGFGEDTRADIYDFRRPPMMTVGVTVYQERQAGAEQRPLLVCAEVCTLEDAPPDALGNVGIAETDTPESPENPRPYDENDVTDGLAFVIISHGPNGFGAVRVKQDTDIPRDVLQCNAVGGATGEEEINTTNATSGSSSCGSTSDGGGMRVVKRPRGSDGFDDIVLWMDGRHLIRKTLEAGALRPDFPILPIL